MMEYTENRTTPQMMTIPELANFLRVSKNTAYSLVSAGSIPSVKIGRQIRINRDDVMKLFDHSSQD